MGAKDRQQESRDYGGGGGGDSKKQTKKVKEHFNKKLERHEERIHKEYNKLPSVGQKIANRIANAKKERRAATSEGYKEFEKFYKKPTEGYTPKERASLQYEGERQVDREQQNAQRKLLGEQSSRGIVGRGGVGEAQRRELMRAGQEARGTVTRDLDKLSSDRALKKQAQKFAMGQGEATHAALDREKAEAEKTYENEQREAERREKKFYSTLKKL